MPSLNPGAYERAHPSSQTSRRVSPLPQHGIANPRKPQSNSVGSAPKMVAKTARAQNKFQKGLKAGAGIKIHKSNGNTVIEATAGDGGGYSEGGAADAVGSDGKLNKVVKHSTWATPSAYPTELRSVASGVTSKLSVDGIGITGGPFTLTFDPATGEVRVTQISTGDYYRLMFLSGPNMELAGSSHTLTVKEIDVCEAGVSKKMLIVASDPY